MDLQVIFQVPRLVMVKVKQLMVIDGNMRSFDMFWFLVLIVGIIWIKWLTGLQ